MRVLFVTSEVHPLIKTGGLADVSGALPPALEKLGMSVKVLVPGYPAVMQKIARSEIGAPIDIPGPLGTASARLLPVRHGALDLLVLDAPDLFTRAGGPYNAPGGQDWPDNQFRFGCLCHAAAWLSLSDTPLGWRPDILHGHDWQAGLAVAYCHLWGQYGRPRTVFTVHNLAYQGQFPAENVPNLRLPWEAYRHDGLEFWGGMSFLKAGLWYADQLTTVSPTYAREIQTPELGCGLDGLLSMRSSSLSGILNGIDDGEWNPATDPFMPATFSDSKMAGKATVKRALQVACALTPDPQMPLFCVVSRLTHQKGLDLLADCLPDLVGRGAQFVLVGTGDPALEHRYRMLAAAYPGRISAQLKYDEGFSHLVIGGSDAIIVPSRFEPCGLTQMYGLRYGTLPVVRRTGGLADTVTDATPAAIEDGSATGFTFDHADAAGLSWALSRALDLWKHPKLWKQVMRSAMTRDNSWDRAALDYQALYQNLLEKPL